MSVFEQPGTYLTVVTAPIPHEEDLGIRFERPARKAAATTTTARPRLRVVRDACATATVVFLGAVAHVVVFAPDRVEAAEVARSSHGSGTEATNPARVPATARSAWTEMAAQLRDLTPPGLRFEASWSDGSLLTWYAPDARLHVALDDDPEQWRWWILRQRGDDVLLEGDKRLTADGIALIGRLLADLASS